MKFYYSTGTCSTSCHIAFEEAGLKFDPVEVSWKRKVNVEELGSVNPLGQVPALITDAGNTITQNVAILEYIGDKKPESGLIPRPGTDERAEVSSWLAFAASDFQKSFYPILGAAKMTSQESAHADLKNYAVQNIERYLAHLDKKLIGKDFITGRQFTVADAYLFTVIGWCKWAKIKLAPYPNVKAYMKRVSERPAVRRVLEKEELGDYLPE